ncbi:hypothetical protein [Sorangium sp. So ce1153]|uniref:hypothetical protein n=1 Tax=Sorangium sp. So ce1153 TaxID=3133333 RepID=UPI003F6158C5
MSERPLSSQQPRPRRRLLAGMAATGLGLSALVHVLSYAGIAVHESVPVVWALHVGIFVVFIPFIIGLIEWKVPGSGSFRVQLDWSSLARFFPRWVPVVAIGLFVYVSFNFQATMSRGPKGGFPRAAIAAPPTHEQNVYQIRGFSGHWLLFYALPTLFFVYVPPAPRRPEDDKR